MAETRFTTAGGEPIDPLEAYVRWSRGELEAAGLSRKATDDGSVFWSGGPAGAGTLLLLHGVNDQAGTWAGVAKLLAPDLRLVIPDLAGHGESEPKDAPIDFSLMLARLEAVIEREVAGRLVICGNSMGGWLATLYALEHPGRVERLVLENGGGLDWPLGISLSPETRQDAARLMKAVYGPNDQSTDEILDAVVRRTRTGPLSRIDVSGIARYAVDSRLEELQMPVSIVWGRDDGILPLEYAKVLHERLPRSTLAIIDGAGHIPHRQKPERFVECLNAIC